MATSKETVDFISKKLGDPRRFTVKSMFGEYALYADEKVVGLVCDNLFYVKILPASKDLDSICERGEPYSGAKPYYILEESQLSTVKHVAAILLNLAKSIPAKKKKARK